MNKLTIIGNLTKAPELRTTPSGDSVCTFTVAVNRRKKQDGTQEADFFHVSAWRAMGENCSKYLAKGRKVAVVGSVSVRTYNTQDGRTMANMEVLAQDVEFLSSREEAAQQTPQTSAPVVDAQTGFEQVQMDNDLPF